MFHRPAVLRCFPIRHKDCPVVMILGLLLILDLSPTLVCDPLIIAWSLDGKPWNQILVSTSFITVISKPLDPNIHVFSWADKTYNIDVNSKESFMFALWDDCVLTIPVDRIYLVWIWLFESILSFFNLIIIKYNNIIYKDKYVIGLGNLFFFLNN